MTRGQPTEDAEMRRTTFALNQLHRRGVDDQQLMDRIRHRGTLPTAFANPEAPA